MSKKALMGFENEPFGYIRLYLPRISGYPYAICLQFYILERNMLI